MNERRYHQPADESSFEEFCLVLLRDHWKMPGLARFGHRGEEQHGVDLLDLGGTHPELTAVQCKHHEPTKYLPPAELSAEVEKALSCPHTIKHYFVLTTAKRSKLTQLRVREINVDHAKRGLFDVTVWTWDEIEAAIAQSPAAQRYLGVRQDEVALADTRRVVSEVVAPIADAVLHRGLDGAKALLDQGKLQEVVRELEKIHAHSWSALSHGQRARWLTLRADVHLRCGEPREAAGRLIEALQYVPDDAHALTNATMAMRLLDDPALPEFALAARQRFPASGSLWAAVIASAPTVEGALAALAEVPHHLRESPEIRIAEAGRSDLVRLDPARLDRAVAAAPNDVRSWYAQGHHLLAEEGRKQDPDAWNRAPINRDVLDKAVASFTRVVDIASKEARASLEIDARLERASAYSLLGDLPAVRADVDAVNRIAPADPRVKLARARLLLEEGASGSAIPMLQEVVQGGAADDASFLLARALWRRNEPGDRAEAGVVMCAVAERTKDEVALAHAMTVDALLATGKGDEAQRFVEGSASRLTNLERRLLLARVALGCDDTDTAATETEEALAALDEAAPRAPVTWLARALVQVGRFRDAHPLLTRLCADLADPESIQLLAICASRLGRDDEVLDLGSRCRAAGLFDPDLVAAEVRLLDRYDPDQAIVVLDQILEREPDHVEARVHLANLAARLDRADLLARHVDQLPPVGEVRDAHVGAAVVDALRAAGRRAAAVAYSYDLLRRFFDDPSAHRAFSHAMLWRDRETSDATLTPEVVEPGVAVLLGERGRDSWVVLEDSPVRGGRLETEIRESNPLWAALVGKRVGDQVALAEGPGVRRLVGVKAIVSKLTFRARDVWDQWQYRFKGEEELWVLHVAREDTGEFDPSALFEFAKTQRDRRAGVEGVYRSGAVPISMFGQFLGKDVLGAALHVATTRGLPVRCCAGSGEERAAAMAILDSCSEIVVDATALATLYLLDAVDLFRSLGKQIRAPHSVLTQVRSLLHDARTAGRASGAMDADDDGPVLHVYTDAQKATHLEMARRFCDGVEGSVAASPATAVARMPKDLRDKLAQCMDESSLDCVGVATAPGRVLWTDDGFLAAAARTEVGASTVWTQAVLLWLLERGRMDETRFAEASAKLAGMEYGFTSLSPATVRATYRLSEWKPAGPLVEAVARQFSSPGVPPEAVAQLAALAIRDAFAEPLTYEARRAVLFSLCDAIAARPGDAERALGAVGRFLKVVFGLNVLGQQQAEEAFRAWRNPPRLLC